MRNVACAVHFKNENDPVEISRKEFNNIVGVSGKARKEDKDYKKNVGN